MKLLIKLCLLPLLFWGGVACQAKSATPTPTLATVEATDPSVTEIPATAEAVTPPVKPTAEAPTTAASEPFEARIQLFIYRPKEIEIPVGTTVTWLNEDDIQHSVTSGTPENPTSQFDTGFFEKDESASITFNEPGTYQFFCMRHNHMQGSIIVTEG